MAERRDIFYPRPAKPDPDNAGGGIKLIENHPPMARVFFYAKTSSGDFCQWRDP